MAFDVEKIVSYWEKLSGEKFSTAEDLMKVKKYVDALFFCHLALECKLKAIVAREINDFPPFVHDLGNLSRSAGLVLSEEHGNDLKEIDTFNIRARYDDYKLRFYKKATREYAERYFNTTKELILWLSSGK